MDKFTNFDNQSTSISTVRQKRTLHLKNKKSKQKQKVIHPYFECYDANCARSDFENMTYRGK